MFTQLLTSWVVAPNLGEFHLKCQWWADINKAFALPKLEDLDLIPRTHSQKKKKKSWVCVVHL